MPTDTANPAQDARARLEEARRAQAEAVQAFLAPIDEVRARIVDLRAEIDVLKRSLLSRAEVEKSLDDLMASSRRSSSPLGLNLLLTGQSSGLASPLAVFNNSTLFEVMANVFVDELKVWAMAKLDELAAARDGYSELDADGRASRRAELENQLLAEEIEEETMIEAAEAAGIAIQRRANVDPRAVLGLGPSA